MEKGFFGAFTPKVFFHPINPFGFRRLEPLAPIWGRVSIGAKTIQKDAETSYRLPLSNGAKPEKTRTGLKRKRWG